MSTPAPSQEQPSLRMQKLKIFWHKVKKIFNTLGTFLTPLIWPLTGTISAISGFAKSKAGIFCLLTVPFSALLQYFPQTTTRSLDEDMVARGIPIKLQENFHTQDIRIYHRKNPLQIFHQAGHLTALNFDPQYPHLSALTSPLIYVSLLAEMTGNFLSPQPIDAFSIAPNKQIDKRICFIRPPKAQTASDFVESFGRFTAEPVNFTFKSAPQKLSKVFYTFVMAHEARHCDQDKDIYGSSLNEADADLFAFRLLEQKMQDKAEIAEAKEIMQHLRHILAIRGDLGHFSTVSLQRGSQTPMQAELEYSVPETLRRIMSQAVAKNSIFFTETDYSSQRLYALAQYMVRTGTFAPIKSDSLETIAFKKHLRDGAKDYVAAMEYFNTKSGGALLKRNFNHLAFDLGYLHKNYLPVPDKLKTTIKPAV